MDLDPACLPRCAVFHLKIVHPTDPDKVEFKEATHLFDHKANDWGFTQFVQLQKLADEGYTDIHGGLTILVDIEIKNADDNYFDSKKHTGFSGLKNQGATCYMNSLLQTLFCINKLRKAVYEMPTSEDDDPSSSMPLALQSIFYKLEFTDNGPVSTKDLTRSFGWDSLDAFQQHDVQELFMILLDRLEIKMKGTRVETILQKLFSGKKYNYISCLDIEYKSTRSEIFTDLQLQVKDCANIYDSFDKIVLKEILEGDDMYDAEGHGKQRAEMGKLLEDSPPVLFLHLTRFAYDWQKDMQIKINDRYEFFEELDLDRDDRKYWSQGSNPNIRNKYKLFAVLVHSGGAMGGHYYAYIRPNGTQWLKFDDERVDKVEPQQAIEANFGGEGDALSNTLSGMNAPVSRLARFANAYMLVYVRESEWDSIMCEVTENDISEHVRARLKAEMEEKELRRRERAEAHLYTLVKIATDHDMKKQIGTTNYWELIDFDLVEPIKVRKKASFVEEIVAAMEVKYGIPKEQQRYWSWTKRKNNTYRPSSFVNIQPGQSIADLQGLINTNKQPRMGQMAQMDLYLELPKGKGGKLVENLQNNELIFFKYYDPEGPGALSYLGQAMVPKQATVADLMVLVRKMAGLEDGAPLNAFEEIKFEPSVMVDTLDPNVTLDSAQLGCGDILTFQKKLPDAATIEAANYQFPNVPSFMEYIIKRLSVVLKNYKEPSNESKEIHLDMLKDMNYEDVSGKVAEKLGLDHPLKLRFFQHNTHTGLPRPHPLRWRDVVPTPGRDMLTLSDMVGFAKSGGDIFLYYEEIDMPLPDFENHMQFRVAFHDGKHEEVYAHCHRIAKDATIAALLELVRKDAKVQDHKNRPLRLMEIYQWKLWEIFDPAAKVESISDNSWHLRAEVVREEEEGMDTPEALHVQCQQVSIERNSATAFSDPFLMSIQEEETVGELKARVQKDFELSDKEFETWKVVLLRGMAQPELLEDDVVITSKISKDELTGDKLYARQSDRPALGFEHKNNNLRRTQIHLNRNPNSSLGQEKALKIKA